MFGSGEVAGTGASCHPLGSQAVPPWGNTPSLFASEALHTPPTHTAGEASHGAVSQASSSSSPPPLVCLVVSFTEREGFGPSLNQTNDRKTLVFPSGGFIFLVFMFVWEIVDKVNKL